MRFRTSEVEMEERKEENKRNHRGRGRKDRASLLEFFLIEERPRFGNLVRVCEMRIGSMNEDERLKALAKKARKLAEWRQGEGSERKWKQLLLSKAFTVIHEKVEEEDRAKSGCTIEKEGRREKESRDSGVSS